MKAKQKRNKISKKNHVFFLCLLNQCFFEDNIIIISEWWVIQENNENLHTHTRTYHQQQGIAKSSQTHMYAFFTGWKKNIHKNIAPEHVWKAGFSHVLTCAQLASAWLTAKNNNFGLGHFALEMMPQTTHNRHLFIWATPIKVISTAITNHSYTILRGTS